MSMPQTPLGFTGMIVGLRWASQACQLLANTAVGVDDAGYKSATVRRLVSLAFRVFSRCVTCSRGLVRTGCERSRESNRHGRFDGRLPPSDSRYHPIMAAVNEHNTRWAEMLARETGREVDASFGWLHGNVGANGPSVLTASLYHHLKPRDIQFNTEMASGRAKECSLRCRWRWHW